MIRTGLLRTASAQLKERVGKKRIGMKRSRPKMTPIRRSAKGEECDIQLPGVCNQDSSTVVWCHENSYAAGKGMGLKARDECGAYGCCTCHAVYDGQAPRPDGMSKEYVEQKFYEAMIKSGEKLKRKGLL